MVDLGAQTAEVADNIRNVVKPLKKEIEILKSLLERLAKIIANKAARKAHFKSWYALLIAEEASLGILRKSFKALTGPPPTNSASQSVTTTQSKTLSSSASTTLSTSSSTISSTLKPTAYLLQTKPGTELASFKAFIEDLDSSLGKQYIARRKSFQSYLCDLDISQVAKAKANPIVKYCIPNQPFRMDSNSKSARAGHKSKISKRDVTTQQGSEAHLQLLSQARGKDRKPEALTDYRYDDKAGEGMFIYVIDSGVADSPEFRLPPGFFKSGNQGTRWWVPTRKEAATGDKSDAYLAWGIKDQDGHGTMVSSIAVGTKYGVAKKATLIPVKIKQNEETEVTPASITGALNFIAQDCMANKRDGKCFVNWSHGM